MRIYRNILAWLLRLCAAATIIIAFQLWNSWIHPADGPDEGSRTIVDMVLQLLTIVGVAGLQLAIAELLTTKNKKITINGNAQ